MRIHLFPTLVFCVLNEVSQVLGQIRGVNLGGWLTTEEWMTPSLYANTTAADEWNLCNDLGKETCLSTLQEHWSTFYAREDLVDIAQAGLNTLRIPLGYWAVDLLDYEPYVSGQYPYLIQAVQWAKELSLSVMIVLHGAPGSQNGYAGSGLLGPVLFPSNSSNIDRSLNVLKNLTAEFSQQDVYGDTVKSIELLNEPYLFAGSFSMSELQSFYTQGIELVHGISETMNVSMGDAWYGPAYWDDYFASQNSTDHLMMDYHNFYAFTPNLNLDHDDVITSICNASQLLKQTNSSVPNTVVGEWSLQNGVSTTTSSQSGRTWLRLLFEAQLAAYTPTGPGQPGLGWIFWAWKTEHDVATWSYRRGIAQQYIPADVTNASQLVYPLLASGCVDASYTYSAPAYIPTYVPPVFASSPTSVSKSDAKSGAPALVRIGEVWAFVSAAWAVAWWMLL